VPTTVGVSSIVGLQDASLGEKNNNIVELMKLLTPAAVGNNRHLYRSSLRQSVIIHTRTMKTHYTLSILRMENAEKSTVAGHIC
jgi:hypothetical protein